jgi:hypothetical protein
VELMAAVAAVLLALAGHPVDERLLAQLLQRVDRRVDQALEGGSSTRTSGSFGQG